MKNTPIEEFVRYSLLEASPPEAEKDDIYGEYLFGTYDVRPDITPEEEDTIPERRFKRDLENWFKGYRDSLSKELVSSLAILKKQGKYLPVLDPGDARVYRMLSINYEKWAGLTPDQRLELEKRGSLVVPGGQLKLQRGKSVGSWTTFPEMFLSSYGHFDSLLNRGKNTLVICVADTSSNPDGFLFNPKETRRLAGRYAYQSETLQVKTIKLVSSHYYLIDPTPTSPEAYKRIYSSDDYKSWPNEKQAILGFVTGQTDPSPENRARLEKQLKSSAKFRRLSRFF